MRRTHLIVGILGILAFILSGQLMAHHHPGTADMPAEFRMMYVSRHIYLLAASLVNLVLGLYLQTQQAAWRRAMQAVGSLLILLSPFLLAWAFLHEPALGLAGRGWRTFFGLIGLFAGVLIHLVANVRADSGSV